MISKSGSADTLNQVQQLQKENDFLIEKADKGTADSKGLQKLSTGHLLDIAVDKQHTRTYHTQKNAKQVLEQRARSWDPNISAPAQKALAILDKNKPTKDYTALEITTKLETNNTRIRMLISQLPSIPYPDSGSGSSSQ